MKTNIFQLYLLAVFSFIMIACSSTVPNVLKPDYNQSSTKLIAVLPIENKTSNGKVPQLLRSKVLDELYFKGYSKLPLDIIDKKLESFYLNGDRETAGVVAPQVLKDLVGVDAGMYCTLIEGNSSVNLFYAPLTISARCELRSTQTGEVIWHAQYKSTSKTFHFTRKGLEMKTYEAFEKVIEEVVNKVMKTLPDGPNLRG